jgi:hypothetical protein
MVAMDWACSTDGKTKKLLVSWKNDVSESCFFIA